MHRLLITISALSASVTVLAAAPQTPQKPPTFRSGVHLIQLDVSVLDEQRRPIRDLTASDFEVLENGKPQKIVAFTPVLVPATASPDVAWATDAFADVATNQGAHSRVFLIILDDATLPFEASMIDGAKRAAGSVVERMGPEDLAAVVFTADNRHAQDFTSDRRRLLAAIETFRAGWHSHSYQGVTNPDVYFQQRPARTLVSAVDFLRGITERRKALIFISTGVSTPDWYRVNELYRRAQAANVSIYPVDPSGFGMGDFIQGRLLGQRARADVAMDRSHVTARRAQDRLRGLATNTGGHAVMNTNDLEAGMAEIFAQTGAYYLIGYESAHRKDAYRRTEVRVKRPGVEIRSRRGTWAPLQDRNANKGSLAERAIAGVLPKADLPLQLHLAPFAGRNGTAAVAVAVRLQGSDATRATPLNVVVGAYDPEGREKGLWRQTLSVSGTADSDVPLVIDLKPGRYVIRVGVNPEGTAVSGSVYSDVVIPDFRQAPLALSGTILSVASPSAGAPAALQSLIPLVPTARRDFGSTEEVSGLLRVYQGGERPLVAVTLRIRIADARNQVVHESRQTLDVARFGTSRAAEHRFDLPVKGMAAGKYLLSLTARTDGHNVRQDIPFSVRP